MIKLAPEDTYSLFATYLRGEAEKQAIAQTITSQLVRQYRVPGQLKEWLWTTPLSLPDYWCPKSEVLFASSFFELPLGTHKQSVVVIHDLTAALFPEQRGVAVSQRLMKHLTRAVTKASAVICVSQNTRADLLRLIKLDKQRVFVTPLAADPIFKPRKNNEQQVILAVGTIEPRKNLDRVIQAYADLTPEIRNQYRLVIVGALGWQFDQVFAVLNETGLRDQIEFVGHVTDDELMGWYNRAVVFVYPSLYEGFGLPPLEAMSCGVPVITSNVSALPEVVGEAAILVDPMSTKAITQALADVLTQPKLASKLREAGLQQAKLFSWPQAARQTLDIIHSLSVRSRDL
jgi:glycosyltransferase involved in cell wall biosynthesis